MLVFFVILVCEVGLKWLGCVMVVVGILMLFGLVGGLILGGWFIGVYGWCWIFLVNLLVGLFVFVLVVIVFLRDCLVVLENFDYMGFLLLLLGLVIFLFGVLFSFVCGMMVDWYVLILVIIGLVLIVVFVVYLWYCIEYLFIDMCLF